MSKQKRLVVIGNGMAAMRTLEEYFQLQAAHDDCQAYDITVFGAEPRVNYNRIMLSPLLAGQTNFADIVLQNEQWYAEHNIQLHLAQRVTQIDRIKQTVHSEQGVVIPYDKLLIATGSSAVMPAITGHELQGVQAFRDVDDVNSMLQHAQQGQHAVIIGGGLLGIEAAYGLSLQGMHCTILQRGAWLMNQQLDAEAGQLLLQRLSSMNIQVRIAANTQEIIGEGGQVTAVKITHGAATEAVTETLPADCVIMAAGIRPNIELAEQAGLQVEQAILVNDCMQTYDPAIYAIGECTQHRGQCYGVVAPIWDQAKICAAQLAELSSAGYSGSQLATTLKVSGADVYSAGEFASTDPQQVAIYRDPQQAIYKKLVFAGPQLVGVVLYGDVADGSWYFDLIKQGQDISAMRDRMIFGRHAVPQTDHRAATNAAAVPHAA